MTSNLPVYETKDQKIRNSSLNRMDAIACGVHARFEESTGYAKKITETTINIARALGVPKKEINRWAARHSNGLASETGKFKEIKYLLEKYYGSSLGIIV